MIGWTRQRDDHNNRSDIRLAYYYREAAKLLGVSERTVCTWVKSGELRAMMIGRTVRISHQVMRDFIAEQEQQPPDESPEESSNA